MIVDGNNSTFEMSGTAKVQGNQASANGGGVAVATNSSFNMKSGEISGNTAQQGGGVYVFTGSFFRISNGTVYGSNAPTPLMNNASSLLDGVSLYNEGTAQYGTFNGVNWVQAPSPGPNLTTRATTIHVVNGNLQ
jgi:hypothetical protein